MPNSNKTSFTQACHYLDRKKIRQLLHLLISHLVVHRPDDPLEFLIDLLLRCKQYRDDEGEPPLLFEPQHVKSLYRTMDPDDIGHITLQQYVKGMQVMGLHGFDPQPPLCKTVPKDTFITEAIRCLEDSLADTLNSQS